MNRKSITLAISVLALAACSEPPPPQTESQSFNVDATRLTVSGISSGAYMAGQYHVAHSADVSGAGLIAGGPYYCATGSMNQGLGPCMNGGDMGMDGLAEYARAQSAADTIDALTNLNGDSVWVFLGSNDNVIHPDVPAAAVEFYDQVADEIAVTTVNDVAAPHGMPTVVGDGACEEIVTPFLNNCGYDAAGELLKSITAITNERSDQADGELITVTQPGAAEAEMLDEALLFVPSACAAGESCGLHIAFHGCQQSTAFVDDAFARTAGYNEWASNNDLLVLYPQVSSSRVAPINPLGCWDWWGYTGEEYATRSAAQISVVKALVDSLSGKSN